jgi:biopolymer transport protein ExbD
MRRYAQRYSMSTLSEINVTPLLDLAFVLLIIFMITTPLMDRSVDLIVPSTVAARNAVDPSDVETISVNRDALVKLNKQPVPLDQLTARLNEIKATKPGLAIIVRAHKELPVQKLIDVMDALQNAQITKVGVVTHTEAD